MGTVAVLRPQKRFDLWLEAAEIIGREQPDCRFVIVGDGPLRGEIEAWVRERGLEDRVVMTGRHDVRRVSIDPSLLSEDKEVLEELLAAAVNDAVRRVEENSQQLLSGMTKGLNMPPGFKMPF